MKIFYADTETTGLDPKLNEIFQFALIVEIDGEVKEEASVLMRPDHPETISDDALRVTGKTREQLLALPSRKEGYHKLLAILAKYVDKYNRADKFQWVGQNPQFDMGFTRALWEQQGDKYFGSWFDNRAADLISLAVAMKMKGHIKPESFKLAVLCDLFGIKLDAHDALNDIRATRLVFRELMERFIVATPLPKTQDPLPVRSL